MSHFHTVVHVFHYYFKQYNCTMSRDKHGSSDATDVDINKTKVLRRQGKRVNMYKFLRNMSPDDECAKAVFSKDGGTDC